ncbi:hypothetical protein KK060_24040, partial [Fulvivirgaceae bacterium PWU20]|nr:hypothetical protein [Chryseosolibacter indicus]
VETYETKGSRAGKKNSEVKRIGGVAGSGNISLAGSSYGVFSFNDFSKPAIVHDYNGKSYNVQIGLQGNLNPFPAGSTANISGSYSYQENVGAQTVSGYGYLYSSDAGAVSNSVMDYHVEKETDFNKRDIFLGVPFNDADNFTVTGEGIGGGFRLYNKRSGHFGPRQVKSKTSILNVGAEAGTGWTFGPGVDIGKGEQNMTMEDWKRDLSSFESRTNKDIDEPVFFRFNNDLGGEWGYNHNDKPFQASITSPNFLSTKRDPSLPSSSFSYNNGERSGRSSYIAYNTNEEMIDPSNANKPSFIAFNKNEYINALSGRGSLDEETKALIGELAVFNESGMRYLYALPVYSKNEKSLSYSVTKVVASNIDNNYIAYPTKQNIVDGKVKVGQEQDSKYASTFLLTEISSPDFVDMTGNGATPDDNGSYTRFNYQKTTSTDWYNWRAPYRGVVYNKNSHSNPKDDQGSYSEGEKELYFLESIETKTHVAIFRISNRDDSREAPDKDDAMNKVAGSPGSVSVKKLDRIDLYSINDCGRDSRGYPVVNAGVKPIKSTIFKYCYSLSPGLPNSVDGKLTLERVHFEYNGVTTTKISPYLFNYSYPDYSKYPSKYKSGPEDVTANYSSLTEDEQNPGYSPFHSDAWGNYQANGEERFSNMRNWLDQTIGSNIHGFDPAAWHLKVIQLPSGGEIHVQYEQDDYAYVQDQEAHVMASLQNDPAHFERFIVNTSSIGVISLADKNRIKELIQKRYIANGNKMYFKFLYRLVENPENGQPSITLNDCNADFITGYATVTKCDIDASGNLYVELASTKNNKLPFEVCKEFVKTQRLGMLDPFGNCVPGMNDANNGNEKDKAIAIVRQLYGMARGMIAPSSICQKLSSANSYLRIPTALAKKGGGVRVKRLLMFDKGVNGVPVLFGNEYLYQTIDDGHIITSGVATNEPQTIREENILVGFVGRKGQGLWSKIIAGKDKKQSEGPIGESILPAPSVGYSRVIVKNIHSGKTNPGFSINEFYTAKDFPITLAHPNNQGTMTSINAPTPDKKLLYGVLVNIIKDKSWATQGFSFILNSMHGQVKNKSSYSGPQDDVIALTKSTLIAKTSYEFYKPGEKVPVVNSLFGDITLKNPGREVDITFAQKKVEESSYDANVEGDLEIAIIYAFIPFILVYPTAMPSVSITEGSLHTHATSKVVRYPAIVKRTTVYQDGILHTQENVGFDQWTGRPVIVRSSDEFKGAYLAQNVPASWEYPNYTAKYVTEGKLFKSSEMAGQSLNFVYTAQNTSDAHLTFAGDVGCNTLAQLTTGDVLDLGKNYLFQVKSIDYSRDHAELVRVTGSAPGNPSSITEVRIVRSGRTNKLTESAGDITFHHQNENSISAATVRKPDSERYVSKASSSNQNIARGDGSLFVEHLNHAYSNQSNPDALMLPGPYEHMNLVQFVDKLPEGCSADLMDATVKNVNIHFKTNDGNVKLELGTFEVQCGSEWVLIKMPIPF